MAQKLGRTVAELLSSITQQELAMWSEYYAEPRECDKTTLQVAQLTSILANVNGNKTTIEDFLFDFSGKREEEKLSIEERVKQAKKRLAKDVKKL